MRIGLLDPCFGFYTPLLLCISLHIRVIDGNPLTGGMISTRVIPYWKFEWGPQSLQVCGRALLSLTEYATLSRTMVNTFVCGQSPQGHHTCLDMELDHVSLAPDNLKVTVVIDNLVWVTRSLRFKTLLAVYLEPVIKEKASMHKNNHVYINILIP